MPLLGRDTWVTGPLPRGVLLLEALRADEGLGRPFRYRLSLLSQDPAIDANDLLGKPMALGMKLPTGDERFFHGIVTRFEKVGVARMHTRYYAQLRPQLAVLDHTRDCRVFNESGQDALAIVNTVLGDRGLTDVESGTLGEHTFRARDYCVQYRESDYHFVQRLLEEEGIYYFFKHDEAKHTIVLAESATAHATVNGYESVPYIPKERKAAIRRDEHFWQMKVRRRLYPGRHTVLSGYDPTALRPKPPSFGHDTSEDLVAGYEFEHYDYPGSLSTPNEAQQEAETRTQIGSDATTLIEVDGNTMGLGVGDLVSLSKAFEDLGDASPFWRDEDFAKQYLITGASYSININQYETGEGAGTDQPFRARYWLLDAKVPFRPRRTTTKPVMRGPQTALVVGPKGEEIWTDELGRVRVQFDWDRIGGHNEKSSCWMRVAYGWADGGWGVIEPPRIGQEVIVRFLDGDPDRPIVGGGLFSADNKPPYDLPAHKTQSGTKSRSSKGGTPNNFNEIRFEDLKGQEDLHTQAERDMSTLVKDCQTLKVGHDRKIVVGHDETNLVEQNRELTVDADDSVVIGGNHDKTIIGRVTQLVAGDHSRKVDGDQELAVDENKEVHVVQSYTLTTDKKFRLNQGDTSMTFKGTNVNLKSAGEVTAMAGAATFMVDKTGAITLASPTGITLTCGASTLAITPGGVSFATPSMTAAGGGTSVMALGKDGAGTNAKQVIIEADGECKITGGKKIKLQEADKSEAPKRSAKSSPPSADDPSRANTHHHASAPIRRHVRNADGLTKTLKVQLHDSRYRIRANARYHLRLSSGQMFEGRSDGNGWFQCEIPEKATNGTLTYRADPEADHVCTVQLDLRETSPGSEEHYRSALKDLGFSGLESGPDEILHLQSWADVNMTNRLDDETKAFLDDLLGSVDDAVNKGMDDDI